MSSKNGKLISDIVHNDAEAIYSIAHSTPTDNGIARIKDILMMFYKKGWEDGMSEGTLLERKHQESYQLAMDIARWNGR